MACRFTLPDRFPIGSRWIVVVIVIVTATMDGKNCWRPSERAIDRECGFSPLLPVEGEEEQ